MNAPVSDFDIRQRRRMRALKALRHTLTAEDLAEWPDLHLVLMRSLSEEENVYLAMSALKAIPDEMVVAVTEAMCSHLDLPPPWSAGEGRQDAALREARAWASTATPAAVKATAMACVDRMPPRTRLGFRKWLEGRG